MKDQSKSSCGTKNEVAGGAGVQVEDPGRAKCRIKRNVHFRNKKGVSHRATNYHTNKLSCCAGINNGPKGVSNRAF